MNARLPRIVTTLTVMLSTGLFAAVLAMSAAGASGAASVSGHSSAQKSPRLTLSVPTTATTGARVSVTGKATRAPRGASVVLQRQDGKKWVQLGRSAVTHGKFKVSFKAPARAAVLRLRAILIKGRRQLGSSVTRELKVHVPVHGAKAAGPTSTPASSVPPASGSPTGPGPSGPITVTVPAITVAVGSVAYVDTPSPVTSLTSIEASFSSSAPGVSAA